MTRVDGDGPPTLVDANCCLRLTDVEVASGSRLFQVEPDVKFIPRGSQNHNEVAMAIYVCKVCGEPIIFRRCRRLPDGTWERRHKPFPIHVHGGSCCGR